jgi:signal transduction histidine kinase
LTGYQPNVAYYLATWLVYTQYKLSYHDKMTRMDMAVSSSRDGEPRKPAGVGASAFWRLGLDGAVRALNRSAEQIGAGVGSLWRDAWPAEMRGAADHALEAARSGEMGAFRAQIPWGARERAQVQVAVTPLIGADGEPEGFSVSARDVTLELETSAFLDLVIQLLPLPLTVRDLTTGRYILANSAAEELIGVEQDGLVGAAPADVLSAARAAKVAELDAEAVRKGFTKHRLKSAGSDAYGRIREIVTTRLATFDDNGPRYLISLSEDVTEALAAAESLQVALAQAEAANRAQSAFLANISHEIRTPLNGLVAGVEILAAQSLAPSERELATMVRSSALALEAKLQRVLELIQLDQGRFTLNAGPFILGDLLGAAVGSVSPAAHAKGLTLACDAGLIAGARYEGDFARLRQVLGEMLGNAVKFTAHGGVRLGVEQTETGLRFTVEDTGVGLSDWPVNDIFDRFRQADGTATRAHGGFGLGLAFARELLELMGGQIGCAPRPGGGAVFWCDVPLQVTAASAVCAAVRQYQPQILVADDHPTNLRVVELILSDFACVRTVSDGREAIEAFAQQDFDLVLMDIQMPVLDGVSAVSEIRRWEAEHNRPRTPIAMLTANTDPDNVAASRAAGADQHIAKPFTPNLLVSSVQALLHASAA